ncbi:3239_t:CDS:2 [Cetraspora pellucida]|uniref:3239_t:CDS:1 n=1 Tax=Cetraspora pellucida TaxID=1433469 RepID=A0A9N9HWP0_9GLOM|nr:3239_t:CDS:2 [Cetraspora pellucida]
MSQQQFNEFVEQFITNQKSVNTQLTQILQHQNAQERSVVEGMTYVQAPLQAKGLTVQLLVFYGKENENVVTWLLQYLNKVQAHEAQKPFEEWQSFANEIKQAFQPLQHQQNILGQVEQMDEADKILNFVEGLKLATKAEASY